MGRILETLRHAPNRFKANPPAEMKPPIPVNPPSEEPTVDGDVSFIEVGPNRSMEASPDVLATKPRNTIPLFQNAPPTPTKMETFVPPIQTPRIPVDGQPKRHHTMVPELITFHQPDHQRSQQYRELAHSLLNPRASGRAKVLLFSGVRPECGTTTVLLNMAITAALHQNLRVLVVEGNQRRPALANRLGLEEHSGLSEVLAGKAKLEDGIRETDQSKLFALTGGSPCAMSGMRFVAQTLRSLFRQLRNRFDLVLVDGPRWDGQPDVVLLSGVSDGVYLVVSESEAESPQVDELYQSIPEKGFQLAGCILAGC